MTSRERLLRAIRHERVDRVPVAPFGLGKLNIDSAAAAELIEKTDPFLSVGLGDPFYGRAANVETTQEGDTTVSRIRTPRGELVWRVQRTETTRATTEFPLKSADDIDIFLSIPFEPPEPNPQAFFDLKKRVGDEALVLAGVGTAICLAARLFSPEDFCLLWADAPDAMKRLVDVAAERVNRFVDRACAMGVDAFRLVGGEYITVQLGPAAVPSLLIEPDRELVDIIHRHGAIAYYHNHGPVMRFLDDFVALGIDALDPLEAPPWGDVNLSEAKRTLGGRVCMVGNLDDMEVIERLPTEEVKRIARERLEAAGARGFVLGGTASGTYTERGARNFIAMVEVAEAFGWVDR